MLNIVLFCAYGASSGLLVEKLEAEALARGIEASINAYSVDEASRYVNEADIILLGPQMRMRLADMEQQYPESKFMLIDTLDYGRMRAANILDAVDKKLNS